MAEVFLGRHTVIPEEKIAEIRDRIDIVALVGEYVPLKRAGVNFKGCCPFHNEKTPSFHVHPDRRFYHCFGCKASGDVFSFLMRLEGSAFPEVARQLAERAGVEIEAFDSEQDAAYRQKRQRMERLAALMDAAAGYYVRMLREHPLSALAREEHERRSITTDTAESFRLGYAPHGWDGLVTFLSEGGWSPAEAEEVGLIVPRRGGDGHYDRFRHRLMFPITDIHGRIVAFSGRLLEPPPDAPERERNEPGAKYVNSPEGPLYHKGDILFGLYEGRVDVRRETWVVVCEGNFDLLALHQAGLKNSVAPMGTALTEAHVKLLRRYAERVVLLFDGDNAGKKAVRASYPLLMKVGIGARVVTLPPGEDPDGFLRTHGPELLRDRIDAAPGIVEHLIDEAAGATAGDARGKAEAVASLGPVLMAVDNPVEVQLYVERVARKFAISDIHAVRRQLRQGVQSVRNKGPRRGRQDAEKQVVSSRPPRIDLPGLECELLSVLLDNPDLFDSENAKNFTELLTSPELRAIFQTASRMVESRGDLDASALLAELSGNPATVWLEERLAIQEYDGRGAAQALGDGIPRLARQNIERKLPELQRRIVEARRQGDDDLAVSLTHEYGALFQSSKKLLS